MARHDPRGAGAREVCERELDGFFLHARTRMSEVSIYLAPGQEGHTLEQSSVHAQYVRFYESRIESYLRKHGVTSAEFMEALLAAEAASPGGDSITLVSSK